MGITQSFDFDNAGNFNLVNTQIQSGKAKLALIPNPEQIFSQLFTNDTGFTYDNTKAEFVGGVLRQKDLRPVGAAIGGRFTSSFDLNWANPGSSLVGNSFGGSSIVAGKLRAFSYANAGVYFENAAIATLVQTGCVKFKYTPNYSGSPSSNITMFELSPPTGINNRISLFHGSTGAIRLTTINDAGATIHPATPGASWSPVAGTEYEIEYNFDTVTGAYRVFVNGVLHSTFTATAYTRAATANRLYLGAGLLYNAANAEWDSIVIFPTVQHTSGYTPGYTLPDFIYAGSKVDGPNFSYSGVGTVLSLDDGTSVETGSPRYIVGGQYWNGSAWVASNGSYAQANPFATVVANFISFNTGGGGVLPWSVVFTDTNTLSSVDSFSVEVTGQKYSPTGHLEPVQGLEVKELLEYSHSILTTLNSSFGVVLKIDGELKYYDGDDWVDSDGSVAQSNTAEELSAGIADLSLGQNSTIFLRWIFSTSSNTETSEIDSASIQYNFGKVVNPLVTCLVYGYLKNISDQPVSGAKIKFELNQKPDRYKEASNNILSTASVEATTDSNGYFSIPLVRSSEYDDPETQYKATIVKDSISIVKSSSGKLLFQVPDATTKDITDLLPVAV